MPQGDKVWLASAAAAVPRAGRIEYAGIERGERRRRPEGGLQTCPHGNLSPAHGCCKASTALAGAVFATPLRAAAPAAEAVTPALIEAAKKEGKVVWYTSVDLPLAEKIGKAFEAKYPGIAVRVERSGAERVFQRIGQEYSSKHPRGRRRQLLGRRAPDRVEARRLARALRAGGCREALSGRAQGPGRPRSRASASRSASSPTTPIW